MAGNITGRQPNCNQGFTCPNDRKEFLMKNKQGQNNLRTLLWLTCIHFFISAFTFGGGYVVVPMVRKYFVQKKKYFSEDELMDIAAVSQSSPGAIAVNLAALTGWRICGAVGAALCCLGAILPPLIILSVISAFYTAFASNLIIAAVLKGMQAGVAALIADLVLEMYALIIKQRSKLLTLMVPAVFLANFILDINVAVLLLLCCLCSLIAALIEKRRKKF